MPERPARILVVDDEAAIRQPVKWFLTNAGYFVDEAENGVEALDLVKISRYDLIILDLRMPYLDGRQFLEALRENRIRVPVLVMSAVETTEKLYLEQGRLIKTFSLSQLKAQVEKILSAS
ncbi:MAG: response regulator [candidate division FCPU426 bacterium]